MNNDIRPDSPPPRPSIDENRLHRLEQQAANSPGSLLAVNDPEDIRRLALAGAGGTY